MAIIQGKYLRGSVGNYAFRKVGNRNIIQSKPGRGTVRQTEATRESSAEFGLASTAGKMLRYAFGNLYGYEYDGRMMNRMVRTLTEVIGKDDRPRGQREITGGDISRLKGFEFNAAAPLRNQWRLTPEVGMDEKGTIRVSFPSFAYLKDLTPSSSCSYCIIKAQVIAFDFKNSRYKSLGEEKLEVKLITGRQEATEWTFESDVPEGCLLLVGFSLKYYRNNNGILEIVQDRSKHSSTEIIGSFIRPDRETPYEEPPQIIRVSKYESWAPDSGWRKVELNSKAYNKLQRQRLKQAKGKSPTVAKEKTKDKDGWTKM